MATSRLEVLQNAVWQSWGEVRWWDLDTTTRGFSYWLRVFVFYSYLGPVCCLFSVFLCIFSYSFESSASVQLTVWKTRLRNDLLCVERDVKLYLLTHRPYNTVTMVTIRSTDERRILGEDSVEGECLWRSGSSPRCSRRCRAGSGEGMIQ